MFKSFLLDVVSSAILIALGMVFVARSVFTVRGAGKMLI